LRARQSLEEMEGWLNASPLAHLRSDSEQRRRFARWPGSSTRPVNWQPRWPSTFVWSRQTCRPFRRPGDGRAVLLEELVAEGATKRYGTREEERVAGAWRQIDHELGSSRPRLRRLLLTVWGHHEFCRRNDIYCQGRGSAANSAVCFSLGITNADAVKLNLFFERFLSRRATAHPTSTSTSSPAGAKR